MAQTAQLRRIEVADNEAQRVFRLQREAYARHRYPSYEQRPENLRKLERVLSTTRPPSPRPSGHSRY